MKTEYLHPKTGKKISRQRLHQITNVQRGFCANHAHRIIVEKGMCQECLDKYSLNVSGSYPSKSSWAVVDWTKHNMEIAQAMGVTNAAVKYQRRKRTGKRRAQFILKELRSLQSQLP